MAANILSSIFLVVRVNSLSRYKGHCFTDTETTQILKQMLTFILNKGFRPNVLAFFKGLGCLSFGKAMTCDL